MNTLRAVIVRPLITEKAMNMKEREGKYVFEVHPRANKLEIKRAVEEAFDVTVIRVRTLAVHGKRKRWGMTRGKRPDRKKAIVTLREGDIIEFFESV